VAQGKQVCKQAQPARSSQQRTHTSSIETEEEWQRGRGASNGYIIFKLKMKQRQAV